MCRFVSLKELDGVADQADSSFSPYLGHNSFREKYFSGLNKKSGNNKPDVTEKWTSCLPYMKVRGILSMYCYVTEGNRLKEGNEQVICLFRFLKSFHHFWFYACTFTCTVLQLNWWNVITLFWFFAYIAETTTYEQLQLHWTWTLEVRDN